MLAHSYVVTYHLKKRLVIIAISHCQSRYNSHCEQQTALYAFIFFKLFHPN